MMHSPPHSLPGRVGRLFLAVSAIALVVPRPAHASYVDPLTGSIILQVLAAGALSLVFTMKRSWRWLGGRWNALRESLRRR
jgi:hypothetical protein